MGLRTPPAGRSRPWTAVDSEVTRVGRPVAEAREGRAATGWAAHSRPGPGRRGLVRPSSGLTPARPARCCAGARAAPARRNLQRIPHWGRVLIVWPQVPHVSPGTRPDAGAPSAPTPPTPTARTPAASARPRPYRPARRGPAVAVHRGHPELLTRSTRHGRSPWNQATPREEAGSLPPAGAAPVVGGMAPWGTLSPRDRALSPPLSL